MIRITSKQEGFRRCGVSHPAAPTEHADDAFTSAQLKQLQAEPMLVVEIIGESSGSQGGEQKALNVAQTVELVASAATIEELDKLAEGETRKGVLDAITKRRSELAPE